MHNWLLADLAATKKRCVLAYWHHPRFQVGAYHRDNRAVAPLWNALVDAGAEIVLAGHDHNFQQLVRMGKNGERDPRGIRSFVVGTGGAGAYPDFDDRDHPAAAESRFARRVGVLVLTLGSDEFRWRFLGARGTGAADILAQGRDICR
jgi:alkaline phosphatase